ncbi:MAG: dienelactone hydrolase family protein [Pirellulaceae bacterium]
MIHQLLCTSVLRSVLSVGLLSLASLSFIGCGLKLPEIKPVDYERFDLSELEPIAFPPRPAAQLVSANAAEYIVDLGIPDGQPGHDSEVRVILPHPTPSGKVPALIVNGAGAYLFSGMVLSDEDIEPLLPYVEQGFAVIAYETDGCQPDFDRDPTASDIAQMTRRYVASKAGLINAQHALSYALEKFPEIDADQLYTIGHSSGAKQALLLAAHDDRIRGCVGFAPACQMDFGSQMTVARIGGGDAAKLSYEVNRSMPLVHAKNTKVPMLLLYSSSDQVTRPAEVLTYAKAVGKNAVAVPVKCSGHGSVPDAGYKFALSWLRAQTQSNAGSSVDPKLAGLDEVDHETTAAQEPTTPVSYQDVVTPAVRLPQSTGPKPVQMPGGLDSGSNSDSVQSNPYFAS